MRKSELTKALRVVGASYAAHIAERDEKKMQVERRYEPILGPMAMELTRLRRLCRRN